MGVDVKSFAGCCLLAGSLITCTDSEDGGFGCLWLSFLLVGCSLISSRSIWEEMPLIKARNREMGEEQGRFLLNLFQSLRGRENVSWFTVLLDHVSWIIEPEAKKGLMAPACSYNIKFTPEGRFFCMPESHCSEEKGPRCSCSRSHVESVSRKILLVEDTEINRMLLRKLFIELNLLFEEAENGQIAVDYFKQGKNYDLVLMDKEMPVMDGHEATRRIRLLGVKTPIVALTGNSLQSDKDMFFQAGANDFKTKPLSRDDLVLLLARYGLERSPTKSQRRLKR